jgi:hypothetical protein
MNGEALAEGNYEWRNLKFVIDKYFVLLWLNLKQ